MNSATPRVSVVMAVYNAERFLPEAIASIQGQTESRLEFLIVDDGSTDGSIRIIERTVHADPRVHLIHQSNAGPASARNRGIQAATADYVAIMDADDIADADRLRRQADYLDQHPNCLAVGCRLRLIDPAGELIAEESSRATSHQEIERVLFQGLGGIPNPGAMIRREALLALHGYREDFPSSEDLDLWLRLAEQGELANLPEILLSYRLHPTSLGTSRHDLLNQMAERAVREAYSRRGIPLPEPLGLNLTPPRSVAETYLNWGWMSAQAGRLAVARRHAWQAVQADPWSWRIWYAWFRITTGLIHSLRASGPETNQQQSS